MFEVESKKDTDGRLLIHPGYYRTPINTRKAFRVDGPLSMDAPQGDRRKILFGAVVMNHVQSGKQLDVFPVHSRSFDLFYARSPRHAVHHLSMKKPLVSSLGKRKNDLLVKLVLQGLRAANDIMIYGYRGKPEKVTFGEIGA
ncbi:MAG: hypothetical protein UZ21_OP11001000320 [Microgenomates bacterium OLB22]|nr:MAG: hypothetical protein UZ21_OP11001000320 [Microgenomates bacterium OLB22]